MAAEAVAVVVVVLKGEPELIVLIERGGEGVVVELSAIDTEGRGEEVEHASAVTEPESERK